MNALPKLIPLLLLGTACGFAQSDEAQDEPFAGKVGLYGIHMVPYANSAPDYSRPSWGGGLTAVFPFTSLDKIFAVPVGFEVVNFLTQTTYFQDRPTGLRVEQQTSQDYIRLYGGLEAGGHGNGFLRPHGGINLALEFYSISTDVVVPDDVNRENEIRQNLRRKGQLIAGYDLNFGLELNFANRYIVDGGARYVKSFGLPEQLGDGSVTIYPDYFQIYLGFGVSFQMIGELGKN